MCIRDRSGVGARRKPLQKAASGGSAAANLVRHISGRPSQVAPSAAGERRAEVDCECHATDPALGPGGRLRGGGGGG
eukprot:12181865-Alexandrium_andersonii.AAC.1